MMDFFTHLWKSLGLSAQSRLLITCLTFLFSSMVWAGDITIKEASLVPVADNYVLNIDFDANLGEEVEAAMHKGVALHFLIEFKLFKPRKYWFDDEITSSRQHVVLSYHALSRQFLLKREGIQQTFTSWQEAREAFTRLRDWNVFSKELVKKGGPFQAAVLIRLDPSRLPKPLQLEASSSGIWNLTSLPYQWQPGFPP